MPKDLTANPKVSYQLINLGQHGEKGEVVAQRGECLHCHGPLVWDAHVYGALLYEVHISTVARVGSLTTVIFSASMPQGNGAWGGQPWRHPQNPTQQCWQQLHVHFWRISIHDVPPVLTAAGRVASGAGVVSRAEGATRAIQGPICVCSYTLPGWVRALQAAGLTARGGQSHLSRQHLWPCALHPERCTLAAFYFFHTIRGGCTLGHGTPMLRIVCDAVSRSSFQGGRPLHG